MRTRAPLLLLAFLLLPGHARSAPPVFSPDGPDAAAYGAPAYPVGTNGHITEPGTIVGSFSHYDLPFPGHLVAHATPAPLRRDQPEPALAYTWNGARHTIQDYMDHQPATALLLLRNDQILFEHYQYGRTDGDRLVSQSMAKTVTALLVGIAVAEGRIRSIDDRADTYATSLTGTLYGETPIRALLTMSSGVAYNETYGDPNADNTQLGRDLFRRNSPGAATALGRLRNRAAPPGTRFNYAGADTEALGLVLRAATGTTLADYLSTRIWQPMGAEADAIWSTDGTGQEVAYCCLSAVARDWARLGLLMANDGAANGHQLVPRDWIRAMTTPAADYLAPGRATRFDGYGYQTWLVSGTRRLFAFRGIHGQTLYVDPDQKLVLLHTAVRLKPTGDPAAPELNALWRAALTLPAP